MNTKKWTMRDGTKIRIKDMTTEHLRNTVAMLNRIHGKNVSSAYRLLDMFSGEQALLDIEQMLNEIEEEGSTHPLYQEMVDELERRKEHQDFLKVKEISNE